MPPRYSYWTILAGGLPTAFRAADRDELVPTFTRIREKHPDAEMKWFARGRLWDSPDDARREIERRREAEPRGPQERGATRRTAGGGRGRDWRPGGEHRDPRQKYADAKKAKNLAWRREKFAKKHGQGAGRPGPSDDDRRGQRARGGEIEGRGFKPAAGSTAPRQDWRREGGRDSKRGEQRGDQRREQPRDRARASSESWGRGGDRPREGDRRSKPQGEGRQRDWRSKPTGGDRQRDWRSKPPEGDRQRDWRSKPTGGDRQRDWRNKPHEGDHQRDWRNKPHEGDRQRDWRNKPQDRDRQKADGRHGGDRSTPPSAGRQREWREKPQDRERQTGARQGEYRGRPQSDRGQRDWRNVPPERDRKSAARNTDRDRFRTRDARAASGGSRDRDETTPRRPHAPKREWPRSDRVTNAPRREFVPKRPIDRGGFARNQGTEEPAAPPPAREPRPSETPAPAPPPRPSEPSIPPPGPPERGRLVKRPRRS